VRQVRSASVWERSVGHAAPVSCLATSNFIWNFRSCGCGCYTGSFIVGKLWNSRARSRGHHAICCAGTVSHAQTDVIRGTGVPVARTHSAYPTRHFVDMIHVTARGRQKQVSLLGISCFPQFVYVCATVWRTGFRSTPEARAFLVASSINRWSFSIQTNVYRRLFPRGQSSPGVNKQLSFNANVQATDYIQSNMIGC